MQLIPKVNLRNWAMSYLGVTQAELSKVQVLKNREERESWAKQVLQLTTQDLAVIRHIRNFGGTLSDYVKNAIGVESTKELTKLKKWSQMSKVQKIMMLCPNTEAPRDFLNRVYCQYLKDKKRLKTSWKQESYKSHLLEIKSMIERMIIEDEMSLDDFMKVGSRLYMACYTWSKQKIQNAGKIADHLLGKVEQSMAA